MNCPFCQQKDTKVVDSRLNSESNLVKRRRRCDFCHKRFTTYEKIKIENPMVVKNDGRREEFDREKIHRGIQKACQKRPIPTATIEKVLDRIEKAVLKVSDQEINTKEIGNIVMKHLQELDAVAYVRFASVYKTFKDIDEFVKDLTLDKEQGKQNGTFYA